MTTEWPTREEWARQERTWYGDSDELNVSRQALDYATATEVADALAEARALWREMGRQMTAIGPAISEAEWRRRFTAAPDRAAKDALCASPEFRRMRVRESRGQLNREIIKPLAAGRVPDRCLRWGNVCGGEDFTDSLPKAAELVRRHHAAWEAAWEAKIAEYATRPVDDAAWEAELRRRESVTRWLAGDRFLTA